jgi:hypothetical protein
VPKMELKKIDVLLSWPLQTDYSHVRTNYYVGVSTLPLTSAVRFQWHN